MRRGDQIIADACDAREAEWADGDAIAAHIANKNQYFCTRDVARGAGQVSVLSMQKRNWLEAEYGATFVTPEQLAQLLSS